jgi:hypothetical protein
MPELCLSRSASPNSLKRSSSKSVSGNFRKAACGLIGSRIGTYCRSRMKFELSRWPTGEHCSEYSYAEFIDRQR